MSLNGSSINAFGINRKSNLQKLWMNLLGESQGDPSPVLPSGPTRGAIDAAKSRNFIRHRHDPDDVEYAQLVKKDEYLTIRLGFAGSEHRLDRIVVHDQTVPSIGITNINTAGPKVSIYNIRKS